MNVERRESKSNSCGYLPKRQAAEYVGLSARTLDIAKARGALPYIRFGARRVLFARADLDAWLTSYRVTAETPR